ALGVMVLMLYILSTTSNSTFVSNWNTLVAGNNASYTYSALQPTAASNASFPGIATWFGAIVAALPFAFLFLFGGNYANAFAGEIKNVRKSLPIALFLSLILGLGYWIVTSTLTVNTIGFNWATTVGYGWIAGGSVPGNTSYSLTYQPTQPLSLRVSA